MRFVSIGKIRFSISTFLLIGMSHLVGHAVSFGMVGMIAKGRIYLGIRY
jgi:hypothetical protein